MITNESAVRVRAYEIGEAELAAWIDEINRAYGGMGLSLSDVALASDFTPPETTHSVNSTPIYGTTLGSSSSTLGQGAFTAYLKDGVTDALVALKNQILWFKFFPDRYASPYILTQGKLGISRTFPAGDAIQAACTISASEAAAEAAS